MNRNSIPAKLKRQILVESGHRCAIPTCRATTTEIAHIDAYSKVKDHKYENLIALCPNCHTRYDKGEIDRLSILEYKKNLKNIRLNFVGTNIEEFDITLWCDYKSDSIIFYVANNSSVPVLDFILYADKIYRDDIELLKSPHTLEILFGTVPAQKVLEHKDSLKYFNDDVFGFPILTGQFSDKHGRHWAINESFEILQIEFRNPFD